MERYTYIKEVHHIEESSQISRSLLKINNNHISSDNVEKMKVQGSPNC